MLGALVCLVTALYLRARARESSAAARLSAAQLESVIDTMNDGLLVFDRQMSVRLANRATARLNGVDDAGAMQHDLAWYRANFELAELDGTPLPVEQWPAARVLRGESILDWELRRRRRSDGKEWLYSFSGKPVRDERGEVTLATIVTRDVTEEKRSEQALHESERKYSALVEQAADALFVHDGEGRFVAVNPRACEMLGYTREELLRMGVTDIEQEFDLPAAKKAWAQIEPGKPFALYGTQRRKDGTLFPVEVHFACCLLGGQRVYQGLVRDITERRRAEQRISTETERLAVTLRSIGDAVIATDDQGCVTLLNPVASALTGWAAQDAAGRPLEEIFRIVNEDTGATVESPVRRVLREGKVVGLANHTLLIARDGQQRPIADSSAPIRDAAGKLIGVVLVFRDQTDERRVAQALGESEQRYRSLVEQSLAGIYLLQDGRFQYANPRFAEIFGFSSPEAVAGTQVMELVAPQDRAAMSERARKGPSDASKDARFGFTGLRRDGALLELEVHSRAIEHRGRPASLGMLLDVTERNRAQRAMVQSEAQFRQLAENIREVFWVSDVAARKVLYVSPGFEAIWGRSSQSVLDNPLAWMEAIHPDDRERVKRASETKQLDGTYDEVYRIVRPDGSKRWIRDRAFPVRGGDGAVLRVVGIAEDITELRQTEEQLRQAQKMEAVGRLAGGVAHDFNNILSVILSYAQVAQEDLPPGHPLQEALGEIRRASTRAAELTQQLLLFSRQQVVAPKIIDLNELIANTEKMIRRLVGEDVQLVFAPGASLGQVRADPGNIEQVLMNLVVNARDAMPQGGRLTIETSNVEIDASFPRTQAGARSGPYVMLAVTDTGCGMDPATQARIFEPFFTTKERGKGTGLGLSTVFGIVQQSEGTIWVYSEPGKGTSFKIYLPRAAAKPEPQVAAPQLAPRGKETVLLVEDEEQVRAIAQTILKRSGYRVVLAQSARDALRICEQGGEAIDLLLTDVVMPDMSGAELARRLAESRPGLRVLCMSGYTDDSVVRHGVIKSQLAFLQKPFTPESLSRKVREVLNAAPVHADGDASAPAAREPAREA